MKNNDNNQNNYVTPQKVDLNDVNVENTNLMLNRERDTIVSATIQANEAIDSNKAKTVNNEIKLKKSNPFFRMIFILFLFAFAGLVSYLGYRLVEKAMNYQKENTTTTTTTTTSATAKISKYLNNFEIVRKFQNNNNIILLAPSGYNMKTEENYFMYLTISNNGLLDYISGTYTIIDEQVVLKAENGNEYIYVVNAKGLVTDGVTFEIYDSEMKYYTYKSDIETKLLIINGTLKNELALFIESNSMEIKKLMNTYIETNESISITNGPNFIKNGNNIEYNGVVLTPSY